MKVVSAWRWSVYRDGPCVQMSVQGGGSGMVMTNAGRWSVYGGCPCMGEVLGGGGQCVEVVLVWRCSLVEVVSVGRWYLREHV